MSGEDSTDVLTGEIGGRIETKRRARNIYRDRFSEKEREERSVDGVATRGDETRQRQRHWLRYDYYLAFSTFILSLHLEDRARHASYSAFVSPR